MKACASTMLPPLSMTATASVPTTTPRLQIAPWLAAVINSFDALEGEDAVGDFAELRCPRPVGGKSGAGQAARQHRRARADAGETFDELCDGRRIDPHGFRSAIRRSGHSGNF